MHLGKLNILLLVLLVAAMVMVAVGSAADSHMDLAQSNLVEKNYISVDEARLSSTAVMKNFIDSGSLNGDWTDAIISASPVIIHDVNGKRLFYLFSVENGGKKIGEIQAAASRVLGGSVMTIGSTSYLDYLDQESRKADSLTEPMGMKSSFTDRKFVSYNYPKLGFQVTTSDPDTGKSHDLIFDAGDYHLVNSSEIHSFYADIPTDEQSERINRYTLENAELAKKTTSAKLAVITTGHVNGFTLFPQVNDYWCGPATAQMISQRYGVSRSQYTIAATVGIGPTEGIDYKEMYTRYYTKPMSSGGLGKYGSEKITGGPTTLYGTVKSEINAQRPVVINTMGHTMAVGGWEEHDGGSAGRYFQIYDPWPENLGAVYNQNFDMARNTYVGSILVKD